MHRFRYRRPFQETIFRKTACISGKTHSPTSLSEVQIKHGPCVNIGHLQYLSLKILF